MFLKLSNCNISSDEESEEEVSLSKEKLSRKEKKAKNRYYYSRHRKLGKFKLSEEETKVRYKRNGRKNDKSLKKYNLDYRTFYKAEAIFNKWLAENQERFNVKLIRVNNRRNPYLYRFEGVIKNVDLSISTRGPEIAMSYTYFGKDNLDGEDSQCFDHRDLAYIMGESFHPQKGFYDSDNVTGNFDYYPTREELYINDVFEIALDTCNELLVPENSLYLSETCGWSSAYIGATDESNKENKRVYGDTHDLDIVDLSDEECLELLKQSKVSRIIKYDLFKPEQEALIRYVWMKKS